MAHFDMLAYSLEAATERLHRSLRKYGGSITVNNALRHALEFGELNRVLARRRELEGTPNVLKNRALLEELEEINAELEIRGFAILRNPGMKGWKIHSLRF